MDRPQLALIASGIIVVLGATALAAAWVYPRYRDMARRSQVVRVMMSAEYAQREIRYRVEAKKPLAGIGKGLSIQPGGELVGATVSDDGVIVLNGSVDGYPIVVALKPYLKGSELGWHCRGLKVVEGWFIPDGGYFPRGCPPAASLDSF